MIEFYALAQRDAAGDIILAVDTDKANLEFMEQFEFSLDYKYAIYTISYWEYVQQLKALGYDVEWELKRLITDTKDALKYE